VKKARDKKASKSVSAPEYTVPANQNQFTFAFNEDDIEEADQGVFDTFTAGWNKAKEGAAAVGRGYVRAKEITATTI